SYAELLEPLDTLQVAPIGFLMVERFFVELFGPGEYALRFFPFLAGIVSIILFYSVAKRLTSGRIALIASLLFTFSYYLIYYTVEVKQYILDVFLLLIIVRFIYISGQNQNSLGRFIISGIIGAVSIWFSNVSVFVLTGIGIWMIASVLKSKKISSIMGYLLMTAFWLGSFAIYYLYFIRNHPHGNLQTDAFQSINFLPGTSGFIGTGKWILTNLGGLFEYSIGRIGGFIGIFLSLIAFYFIYRRKDYTLLIFCLPIFIHLVLSLFSVYPFGRRFTLYSIPVVFIYMSYGLYHLFRKTKLTSILIPVVLIIILCDHVTLSKTPIMKQEIREPMQYINEHYRDGDSIYVQYGSRWAFE
ncbi:glycosyltransferase family 39 protein, partial [bacterium]|nr:glycosyltransferase family 39 protein [bacterium]